MADTYEQNLTQKSSLTTSDFIRVVGSDNVSYKQLVSDVANRIISSGYLVYGATSIPSNADLNTYRTVGVYVCPSGSVAQTLSNCPTTSAFRLEVKQILNADRYVQILYVNISTHPTLYWRTYNGSWSSWYAPALKEQVDALNSNTEYIHSTGISLDAQSTIRDAIVSAYNSATANPTQLQLAFAQVSGVGRFVILIHKNSANYGSALAFGYGSIGKLYSITCSGGTLGTLKQVSFTDV